ncbi:MAG: hypothetical protein SFZ23_04005 [Planctomycetota bacterium]|nr:hypothetical protein [Planctomycetota bacterium]
MPEPTTTSRASIPPAARRLVYWFALPLGVVVFAVISLAVPELRSAIPWPKSGWAATVAPSTVFIPQFVAIFFVWRGKRKIRRAVLAAGGKACVSCLHDLRGIGESGNCPECGRAFDLGENARMWARLGLL